MSLDRKMRRNKLRKPYIDKKTGNKVVPLSPEAVDALKRQMQAFKDKFGREPEGDEPIFFDPDFDTPTPWDEAKFNKIMIENMARAGIREELIYAYARTGMMVSTQNEHQWSKADIAEWNAALAEFDAMEAA
jgi:hypothetical protein